METVKLHRCSFGWRKGAGHSCWRVQQALDDQGVEYEIVKAPAIRGRRTRVISLTGQQLLPVIEFGDGTAYREDSAEMAARIRAGTLFDPDARAPAPAHDHEHGHDHDHDHPHQH